MGNAKAMFVMTRRLVRLMPRAHPTVHKPPYSCSWSISSADICHLLRVVPDSRTKHALARRMTYRRFADEFLSNRIRRSLTSKLLLDALVVWTQIQSFIKGSIEAVMLKRPLCIDEFLALGEDRVRLNEAQRRETFIVFQSYSAFCKEHSYWDDCDRVLELISHLNYTVGTSGWGGGGEREQEAETVTEDEVAAQQLLRRRRRKEGTGSRIPKSM